MGVAMIEASEPSKKRGATNPMESMFWFLGFVIFYFAMQLWILPKLGIQT
jgi:hypothetical protein